MAQSGSRSRLPIRLPVAPGTRWRRAEHLVPEHVGTGERRAVECVEKGRHADPFDPARAYQSDRIEAIRYLAATGWKVSSGLIVGLPGQTDEHLTQSLQLLTTLPLAGGSVSPFVAGEQTPFSSAQ